MRLPTSHRLGIPTAVLKLAPKTHDLRILVASDWHIGSIWCDTDLLNRTLKYADEQDAYILLNGDILEMAIRKSVGSPYECNMTPQQQLEEMLRLFEGRRHRILGVLTGNHEARTQREGDVDIVSIFASQEPVIPYLSKAGVLAIHAHDQVWTIYAQHGVRGCGRKPGAALNAVHDMTENVVADIYVHGHHHRASVTKTHVARYKPGPGFYWQPRWFVNAGTLHRYGGYASDAAYPPTDCGSYLLKLSGGKRGKKLHYDLLDRAFFDMPR